MSINNLNNQHLTDAQMEAITQALVQLENALKPLQINLTPEERSKFGRVNEQNKLFVNKVHDFARDQADLRSPDVNWDEFFKDFKSRAFFENVMNRIESSLIKVKNVKITHDFDNHQDALNDYAYTSYKAGSKAVGYEAKHKELKQFFARKSKTTTPNEEKASEGQ